MAKSYSFLSSHLFTVSVNASLASTAPRRCCWCCWGSSGVGLAGPELARQVARALLWQQNRSYVKLSQELGWCSASALGCVLFMPLLPGLGWQDFDVCTWPCCLLDLDLGGIIWKDKEDPVCDSLFSSVDRNKKTLKNPVILIYLIKFMVTHESRTKLYLFF